jgi:hypothetical protein
MASDMSIIDSPPDRRGKLRIVAIMIALSVRPPHELDSRVTNPI